jgi:hypothetical protein
MVQEKRCGNRYIICIEGHVGADWFEWPEGAEIFHHFDQDGQRAVTLLVFALKDQPALHGVLDKIRDLNLKLIFVQREDPP